MTAVLFALLCIFGPAAVVTSAVVIRRWMLNNPVVGVDLAKPGSDRTGIAKMHASRPGGVTLLNIPPGAISKLHAEMQAWRQAQMAAMIDPPILSSSGRPMTATEVLARTQQQYAALANSRHGGKSYLAGSQAQGLLGGIGMPGLADPGAGAGSAPPPKEAPTAVVPNLLAGMNKEEVGRFIDSVRAQRAKAPDDKRANYDAMIEAAEKRLAEIAEATTARMNDISIAMDMLAKNKPLGNDVAAGLRAGTTITDPITSAGIIGDIMKGLQ